MKGQNLFFFLFVLLIVAGGAFYGGMKYQESRLPAFRGQFGGMMGQLNSRGNRTGFRPVAGEIINIDDKSITVKLQDGSSKIILISDKTSINKADQGSKTDLKNGEQVAVFGSENSDGSITAQNIQLNPQYGRMRVPTLGN